MPADASGDDMEAPDIRAADGDRDKVMAQLGQAYAEGRLDPAEYERRLDLAAHAVTLGELLPLTADLPAARPPAPPARHEIIQRWRSWLSVAIILTGVWAVSSVASHHLQFFWPIVPLGIWGAVNLAHTINPDRHRPDKDRRKDHDKDRDKDRGKDEGKDRFKD